MRKLTKLNIKVKLISCCLFLSGASIQLSTSLVTVEFGHWFPTTRETIGNRTTIEFSPDREHTLPFKCMANYPTEWIYDGVPSKMRIKGRQYRREWTDRYFRNSMDEPLYNYTAHIELGFGFEAKEFLLCRAVENHADFSIVKITITTNASNNQHYLHIDKLGPAIIELPDLSANDVATSADADVGCTVNFEVTHLDGDYYWRCKIGQETGAVLFYNCSHAPECANTFRTLRKGSCVTYLETPPITVGKGGSGWYKTELEARLVFCGPPNQQILTDSRERNPPKGAMDYFFSAPNVLKGPEYFEKAPEFKIHFSWSEINPGDLVWMESIHNFYFTNETMTGSCHVPFYGFSYDPVYKIHFNGKQITRDERAFRENSTKWSREISFKFPQAGTYEISCFGPVWNTTEWATKIKAVTVKDSIGPSFKNEFEDVTFQEGEENVLLYCEIDQEVPDLAPLITWNIAGVPGVREYYGTTREKGIPIKFDKISYDRIDGRQISCTATNRIGQSATKKFTIYVKKGPGQGTETSGTDSGIIVGSVVGSIVVIVLVLFCGIFFLYSKFHRLGNQMTTYLTSDDIKAFFEGKPCGNQTQEGTVDGEPGIFVDNLPYNTEFELPRENLLIDFNTELGSGQFGRIFKGSIKPSSRGDDGDGSVKTVAVKTVRENVHVNYFKALLSELKLLIFIGYHENIVNLIGACTANIKNRELFVAVEQCETSLLKFLRAKKGKFLRTVRNHDYQNEAYEMRPLNGPNSKPILLSDLIQFAVEISTGMEYLSDKKVVHGDLAARNVLITFDWHAKICDFGLSRQLIDYNYVKSKQCPLPWKWMAIESLSQMKFSTMSDVWSFGVTMWEIFSLGDIPYPGLAWTLDFVSTLKNGLRMGQPVHANPSLYDIMVHCWNDDPQSRPTFKKLKESLQALNSNNGPQNAQNSLSTVDREDTHYI